VWDIQPMLKKLLNYSEQLTDQILKEACERNSARVFVKLRVADVLQINNSGISDDLFSFALMAHFDFVVAGPEQTALFVVEFDGPTHQDATQRDRDGKKDQLCEHFHLPILRINSEYINRKYRNLDLLTWFVEVWFAARDFEKAQEEGIAPLDEPFDPMMFLSIPGLRGRFPLWLSVEPRIKLQHLRDQKRCLDYVPAFLVGRDNHGSYRGMGCLRVNKSQGVQVFTAMRNHQFPVPTCEALEEIIVFQVHQKVQDVIDGLEAPMTVEAIKDSAKHFSACYRDTFGCRMSWLNE
jgi:hypothetical protein